MTTYRFPEILGGGEHEATDKEPTYSMVGFDLDGFTELLWIERACLTEVKPALPEEPPMGSFVNAGPEVLHRRDDAGIDWWDYQGKRWLTWAQVCALGTPVRLVPEPVAEPVTLPWSWGVGTHALTVRFADGRPVATVRLGSNWLDLGDLPFREAARALNAAADAAERAS